MQEGVPAFITIAAMPLTYSIAYGEGSPASLPACLPVASSELPGRCPACSFRPTMQPPGRSDCFPPAIETHQLN